MPRPARRPRRRSLALPAVCLLVAAATLAGCATQESTFELAREELRAELEARGLDTSQVFLPFGLTEEMRAWAHEEIPETATADEKLDLLRKRLLDPKHMKLEYEWGYTGTAIEVFERRRANCLAFTNLFVAMAREIGVPVYFLAIGDRDQFRKDGDLIIVSDHIAAGHGIPTDRRILDFAEDPLDEYRYVEQISDIRAVGMFHSNRGAEALQVGEVGAALQWLRTAVVIDPELNHAWLNLGVALRRAGDLEGAEVAYKRALEIDPRTYSAYQNLGALLRYDDRETEALEYEAALAAGPNRNPYSYLALGDLNLRRGDLDQAERFYRRCSNLAADDAECMAALGQVKAAAGDLRTARRLLGKAREIDAENPRARELARQIDG